jgi:hypothetical protein
MTRFTVLHHHISVDFVKFYKIDADDDAINVIFIDKKSSFFRHHNARRKSKGIEGTPAHRREAETKKADQ